MFKRVKKLWLDALRSGEYNKGKGTLKRGDKFCCLGVLTDLYRKETGNGYWVGGQFYNDKDEIIGQNFLAEDVIKWAGLRQGDSKHNLRSSKSYPNGVSVCDIIVSTEEDMDGVSCFNDGDYGRKTFKEIADMLEKVV